MSLFKNPFSLNFPLKFGLVNILFFIDDNLYVSGEECYSLPHCHHDYEIRYIAGGECSQFIENRHFYAGAGDLLISYPTEYHYQVKSKQKEPSSQYTLRFGIEPPQSGASASRQRAYKILTSALRKNRLLQDKKENLLPLFRKLTEEINQKAFGYVNSIQLLCILILTETLRLTGENVDTIFQAEDLKYRGYVRTKLEQFFSFKHKNNVKIEDLADDMKVSVRQATRIMNQIYGMSFSKKLTEIRLNHAIYQLTSTSKNIEEISRDCGFNNSSYFYMSFRKRYGMTPTEFRERSFLENKDEQINRK